MREKLFWIYKKFAEKAELQRLVPRKEFVNGEGFRYFGPSYRLKIVGQQDEPLKLAAGRFCPRKDALPFIQSYSARGREWLSSQDSRTRATPRSLAGRGEGPGSGFSLGVRRHG